MLELMVQITSIFFKYILLLAFHKIKLKLVSNCFFAAIKHYIKEELTLINKQKKILHKKKIVPTVSNGLKETRFFCYCSARCRIIT